MLKYLCAACLLLVTACGGGNNSSSPTAATPQPYLQTVTGSVDVFNTTRHPLSIPRSGTMTLTLSWDTTVDLDLYLASPSCVTLYPRASCLVFQSSTAAAGVSRETVARSVIGGETYNIFVDNLSLTRSQVYTIAISIQ